MSNKQIGNSFEQEFAKFLSEHGFYAHVIAQRSEGQPADIIAVRLYFGRERYGTGKVK